MVGALHGGLERDFANVRCSSIVNPAGIGCITFMGVWCLLGFQVVAMANPACTSGMGENAVKMPY